MSKVLGYKEVLELFLDIWYQRYPGIYDEIYDTTPCDKNEDVPAGDALTDELAVAYPKIYREISFAVDDVAKERGLRLE